MNFKILFSSFFTLLTFSIFAQTAILQGDFKPCTIGCYDYYFESDDPIYELTVQNIYEPALESQSIEYNYNQNGTIFTICYREVGVYGFNYLAYSELGNIMLQDSFEVIVGEQIPTEIIELSPCENPDFAFTACKGSTATYSTLGNIFGGIYGTWEVYGHSNFSVNPDNTVTITWGDGAVGTIVYIPIDSFGCQSEAIIDIILYDQPEALFSIENMQDKYCLGEEVYLINESEGATEFLWSFGDGNNSTEVQPTISYDTPGDYIITLLAKNGCGCEDVYSIEIKIGEAWMPQIDCKGTLCENATVTYTSSDDCGIFDWSISENGTVTAGGGPTDNYITIDWAYGPEGLVNLEVQSCSAAMCPTPASFLIPIISDNAPIKGNLTPCVGSTESYSVTNFGSTEYTWNVSGGVIQAGQNTNTIMVEWLSLSGGTVSLDYNNCYLKCGGSSSVNTIITEKFGLSGNSKTCNQDALNIEAKETVSTLPATVNWVLKDQAGNAITTQNATATFNYTNSTLEGTYLLVAESNSYCNFKDSIAVVFTPATRLPFGILGEKAICPGSIYQYEPDSDLDQASFLWTIYDGSTQVELSGKSITYTWLSAGPFSIALSQKDNKGDFCYSENITENLSIVNDLTVQGVAEICQDEIATYTATHYEGLTYEWQILPASAGTFISEQGKSEIEVQWVTSGNHTVQMRACNNSETFNVEVFAKPIIALDYQDKVCYNQTTIVNTSENYAKYNWFNESFLSINQAQSPALFPGTYLVEVTNDKGCTQVENFTITELPRPEINISTPDRTLLCSSAGQTFPILHAVNTTVGYSFDWNKDNVSIGNLSQKLSTSAEGLYNVLVTDQNGCTAFSNSINVVDCCINCTGGQNPGNNCSSMSSILSFTANPTASCSQYSFTNNSINVKPGSYKWNFNDIGSPSNISTDENPTHTFSNAAYYDVQISGELEDANNPGSYCLSSSYGKLVVPIKAFFANTMGCPGAPMEFTDRSVSLPDYTITSWEWNFDDPTSSDNTSSLADPMHTYTSPGTYNVQLVIGDGSCNDTVTNQVIVYNPPSATIELTESKCEKIAGKFSLLPPNNAVKSNWAFGDPASADKNESDVFPTHHIYDSPGLYNVTAEMENIYGCKANTTSSITIHQNNLSGSIVSSAGSQICEAASTDLSTAIPGATTWKWDDGSTNSTLTVGQSSIYTVTVADDNFCTYTPAHFILDVAPAPQVSVYVEVYDDTYSEIKSQYPIEICEGQNFRLIAAPNPNYGYLWSNSATTNVIDYSDSNGNLPTAGTLSLGLIITDNGSGCSHVNPDIEIQVIPSPTNIVIKSTSSGVLCSDESHTLYVENPVAGVDYYWNNGVKSSSIETKAGGVYFVEAINSNGCSAISNYITIESGPNVSRVPSGCFVKCNPDTICMPAIADVTSYHWFLDGVEVDAINNGNLPNVIATVSGSYELVVTNSLGCTSKSLPLTLTLQDAVGVVEGKIYVDVNGDGVVDNSDTLKAGVTILLSNGETTTSDANGCFSISNLDVGNYTIKADTTGLGGYDNVFEIDFSVVSCDDTTRSELLLTKNCQPGVIADRKEGICRGEIITIDGVNYDHEGDYILYKENSFGCLDSFTLKIEVNSNLLSDRKEYFCPNSSITVEGKEYTDAGTYVVYSPNLQGCLDSFYLDLQLATQSELAARNEHLCPNESIMVEGKEYAESGEFVVYQANSEGCLDSFYLTITESLPAALNVSTTPSCDFSDNGNVIASINTSDVYTYTLDGISSNNTGVFDNIEGGTYEVIVTDASTCEVARAMATVEEIAPIDFSIENTEWDCVNKRWSPTIELNQTSPTDVTITWQNGDTGVEGAINEGGWSNVTVSNACESVTDEFYLEREYQYFNIEMPNIFSPNKDGINEVFTVILDQLENAKVTSFIVSDRMGRLIYNYQYSQNSSGVWDGNDFSGREVPIGVYFYKLEYEHDFCQYRRKEILSGDVTVIR